MINKNSKIYIAGSSGMVGSAIYRKLQKYNYKNIIISSKKNLDLKNQDLVYNFLKKKKPDAVILAAAKVGGILANNKKKAEFIFDNLSIQNNVIHGSFLAGVKKLIFLGSSCVYPNNIKRKIRETDLLSSKLEKTNEPYAIAKIAGIKLCEAYSYQYNLDYKCLMPCNVYGVNDNYDLENCHFLPALIKKTKEAIKNKRNYVEIWGNGTPKRELILSDDLADACIFFLKKNTKEKIINIGSGHDLSIESYAKIIMKFFNQNLKIKKNLNYPNGTMRKLLDVSLAKKYGWKPKTPLSKGIPAVIRDFIKNTNIKY